MKSILKRTLSALLCLSMLLSWLPLQTQAEGNQTVTIEAEDTEYAVWNHYTAIENNSSASGGKLVGGAPDSVKGMYAWFDDPNSAEDLAGGFLDKSNSPYVAFYVEAPADGTYQLSTAGTFWCSGNFITNGVGTNYYAAFLVNGVGYQAKYPEATSPDDRATYQTTEEVAVQLKKGINTIYVLPITEEQDASQNGGSNNTWACVDCLNISGTQAVVPVKAQTQTIFAADAPYVHNYNRDADGVDGMIGGGNWDDTTIPISSFNAADVDKYHAFTITVSAPSDGYYDITATYRNAGNAANRAVGLMVDGVPQAREYEHIGADQNNGGRVDLSVYLSAGDHVLTITAPAKRTAEDTSGNNVSWFNYYELILRGGLTKAGVQITPDLTQKIIQANDTDYTLVNRFDNLNSQNSNATDGINVGSGHHGDNQSLEALTGYFDRENNTYVAFTLEAPEDGEYQLVLRYVLNMSGIANGTAFEAGQAYATFLVNGQVYTADFGGTDGNYDSWMSDTPVTVSLKKGINYVIAMPLTEDQMTFGGSGTWADVDCLKIDGRLCAVKQVAAAEVYPISGVTNLYASVTENNAGSADYAVPKSYRVNLQELCADSLPYVPYVSYTVEAPQDGYYEILTQYGSDETAGKLGYLLDGVPQAVKYSESPKRADLSAYLTAGTHTLVITCRLPEDITAAESFDYSWTDLKKTTLGGGLKLAETQQDPDTQSKKLMEAESDAFYNHFHKIEPETLSGATVIGFANTANNPTLDALKAQLEAGYLDKSNTNYIGFMVSAPEDGEYTVKLRYKINDKTEGAYAAEPYAAFVVNGETLYTGKFAGTKNMLGYTEDVTVTLKKGVNTIYCMSMLKDLEEALQEGWTQVDHLAIDSRLTAVAPNELELKAVDAEYYNLYTKGTSVLGNAVSDYANAGGMYILELSRANLDKVPYFSYTVDAPYDGYYDMTLYFNGAGASDTNAIGVVVDGVPQAAKYDYIAETAAGSGEHSADVSVYLTAGTHTLVFTMQLPIDADAAAGYTYRWTNMVKLQLRGGITKAAEQADPADDVILEPEQTIDGMIKLEAESAAFFGNYAADNAPQQALGATVMGNANTANNPTLETLKAQLEAGIFDKSNISYIGYLVEAPEAGEYQLKLHYQVNDETAGADYAVQPYAAFVVNGEALYTGEYTGRKNKLGDTETVAVTLEKGINTIYCIPLLKDLADAYSDGWTNVDYLAVSDTLTAIAPNQLVLQAYDAPYINLYKQSKNDSGVTYLGSAKSALAALNKLHIAGLSNNNVYKVPYFSYTVDVPANGYYDMTLRFAGAGEASTNAIGLLVDGKPYAMGYSYKNGVDPSWKSHDADMSVYLTKGTHTLVVTVQLPANAEAAKSYAYDWTDLLRLTVSGGIKLASKQANPNALLANKTVYQAEAYAQANYYDKISENWKYSGGKAVTNGGGTRQTDAALQQHLDKKEQSYVEYAVQADSAGKYTLVLGVEFGGFKAGYQPYVWLWVNGQVQKVKAESVQGQVQSLPVTVSLSKGSNVIRVVGATKDMSAKGVWIDHDYLAVSSGLKVVKVPAITKLEAEAVAYYNHYIPAERKSASGGGIMGSSSPSAAVAGVSTQNLSMDNFDAASYLAFTVEAPADGYYTIAGRVHMDKGERYGKLGLLVDGKAYVFGMHQNKWGDQNYAEAAVYLTKGTHLIIATGLLADTFPNLSDVLWIDYDWFELGGGLKLAAQQLQPTTATAFDRFEAESYAIGNMYQRNAAYEEMSGGACNYSNNSVLVQSWEQVAAEGIDGSRTPYVKYRIEAPEDGTYTVRVGMSYKHNGQTEQDYSSIAVVINGQAQEHRLPRFTNNYCKPFPLTMELTLQKGVNEVIFTGVLDDTTADGNYVNLHYDYLDVTGGLTAQSLGQRLEAETSENNAYIVKSQKSASGGSILGEEDWNSVWTNDLTMEKLNLKTYMAMPWVRYNVVAETAGTYEVGIGFNSDGDVPADLVFMGMSVNDGEFQKVYFTKMQRNCVWVEVELKEGDNTILVTAATKDHLDMPNYPSQADGTNLWIDHDYLDLAPGLSGTAIDETPKWTGDAEAGYRVALAEVWGDFEGDGSSDAADGGFGWIFGLVGAGVLGIVIFFIILLFKKKKKEEPEEAN